MKMMLCCARLYCLTDTCCGLPMELLLLHGHESIPTINYLNCCLEFMLSQKINTSDPITMSSN